MVLMNSLFKTKTSPGGPTYEIVEKHLSVDHQKYQVRIKKGGRELYAEDFFQVAKIPRDLTFGRFFLLNENPPKPHFAPSLKEAVEWFTGKKHPKDGYGTLFWGDQVAYECSVCRACRKVPLQITRVERLTVARSIPTSLEIVGWRVVEVESELTGKGTPSRSLEEHKLKAIVRWYEAPTQYLCRSCAAKLTGVGRSPHPAEYFIFDPE
jgi:hypothetical protein